MGSILSVEGKGQEGSIAQLDWNAAATAAEVFGQAGLVNRVELRLACKGLPKKDALSKSDPMAVVYRSLATGQTNWKEAGRTDAVANTADPEFVRPVLTSFSSDAPLPMRVVVYDVDTRGNTKNISLSSQDYIGEVEFLLSDVMSAPGQTLELPLLDVQGGRHLPPGCVVVLKGEPMAPADNRVVRMAFSAMGLAKKDVMSQSDPFLRVLKMRQAGGGFGVAGIGSAAATNGSAAGQAVAPALPTAAAPVVPTAGEDWVPVFRTEVRKNNPDPVWQPIEVDIRQLCSADMQRPLRLQVFDYNSNGVHKLIGECRATLAELAAMGAGPATASTEGKSFVLEAPAGSKGGAAAGGKAGTLIVRQVMVRAGATPAQLMAGCIPCLNGL